MRIDTRLRSQKCKSIEMQSEKHDRDQSPAAFCLQSGSSKFESRSKDIFASLGALEDKHSAFLKSKPSYEDAELMKADPEEEGDDTSAVSKDRNNRGNRSHEKSKLSETRDSDYERRSHSRSLERRDGSIGKHHEEVDESSERRGQNNFRRPFRPPHRPKVPDFKKNPENYTHYSLRDVSESDMSEQSNTRAALAFLDERRAEREKQEKILAGLPEEEPKFDVGAAACSQGLITFSRKKPKEENSEIYASTIKESSISAVKKTALTIDDNDVNVDEVKEKSGDSFGKDEYDEVPADTISTNKPAFKTRRNMKRVIRKKESDDEGDDEENNL